MSSFVGDDNIYPFKKSYIREISLVKRSEMILHNMNSIVYVYVYSLAFACKYDVTPWCVLFGVRDDLMCDFGKRNERLRTSKHDL